MLIYVIVQKWEQRIQKFLFHQKKYKKFGDRIEDIPFANLVLFVIYSGFRPTELTLIKNENVHLKEGNIVGGMKTKAGTDRGVPIHPKIREIVEKKI